MPSDVLLDRVSRAIEANPKMTKTSLAQLIRGKRQDVLAAIGRLCAEGYVATAPGERAKVLTSVRPYPYEPPGEPPGNQSSANGGEPVGNHGGPGQASSAGPAKDGEVRATATGAANGGEPAPVCQPRCKVCKSPEVLQKVNTMLANGFTTAAILSAIAGVNAALPANQRITDDSLHRHRHRHFPIQLGANSVWRELMERRAEAESATYQEGVTNILTPRIFFEAMMVKAFPGVIDQTAEISVADGARAAAELQKMTAADAGTEQMARIMATQNRIVAAFRDLPPPYQRQVLETVDGRTPPPGGARLALIEGDPATDDDFDCGDDEDDDFGDDED